ncbi:2-hydroxyacid dehydrogenase [Jeotgalibacillus soli]|uniref:2-hydroxyacid dehydrogenase n=2 Tax=Jeotgalibacillus soli TaxID=889306 RepID=A0A0C2S5K2_9BACL|nr:2-hydroxyacid dehydrogenase [Jeotgalibacillus soli]
MKTLVITQNIEQRYLQQIQKMIPEWTIISGKDRAIWQDHLQQAEVIVGWKKEIEAACLHEKSTLRWIQSWSAGVNSMPLDKLESNNILLSSANGVHAYPISETIFALMLSLTRNIHTYVRQQQTKTWHHASLSLEMHEKTVGIIGVGTIGKETAKIAKAFGMTVLGVRHSGQPEEHVDEMFTTDRLHKVLPRCDYVVVALPLTNDTHHLFGSEQFKQMNSSAFFINIGRGETVDEKALINALREGQIAGAGLDVVENEPLDENSPLWEMNNVIITPHTSGSTEHYTQRVIENIFIPNLRNYLAEAAPTINVVDYKKGY